MPEVIFGVDVSKDWIDVSREGGKPRRVARADGYGGFAAEVAAVRGLAVFEASGGCDAPLRAALDTAGAAYTRVDPGRARFFAKGCGQRAKTDRVDARILARMGREQALVPTPPVPESLNRLRALHTLRGQLVQTRKVHRTQAGAAADSLAAAVHGRIIALLTAEIDAVEAEIARHIAADPGLVRTAGWLTSCPGVGAVTAAALLALCPELGTVRSGPLAALAGLAPVARDSGTRQGKRHIAGGRKPLRDCLYMAALSACRAIPELANLHNRLKAGGKAPKQALIAVARKLLALLNALVKDQRAYQPAPP